MRNQIKTIREAVNMTQEELAEKSGISRGTISALENNQNKITSSKTMLALAKALNTTVSNLFFANNV